MTSRRRPGEFALIEQLFAPLSRALPGACGLKDDVAAIEPPSGHDVVLKTDAIIAGVHFLGDDPPAAIAKKALRVNLSDFAAKGAIPKAYLLALALPDAIDMTWLEAFASGLRQDQETFAIALAGGDTNATPGALTIAVMMTGFVPNGQTIRRAGAKVGDLVFVTGSIGDAGAGLELLRKKDIQRNMHEEPLIARYRVPEPRLPFGQRLRGIASAALDVSDGLLADLGHIAEASRVRIAVDAARVPLSPAFVHLCGNDTASIVRAATSGDDYEIAFAAPESRRDTVQALAAEAKTPVSEIGRVLAGSGVALIGENRKEISVERKGYVHF